MDEIDEDKIWSLDSRSLLSYDFTPIRTRYFMRRLYMRKQQSQSSEIPLKRLGKVSEETKGSLGRRWDFAFQRGDIP